MKKTIVIILSLMLVLSLGACGNGGGNSDGHVADNYAKLVESKDSIYYYEAKVTEEFFDTGDKEDSVESVMAEGRDGKEKYAVLSGDSELDTRWLEGTGHVDYTIYDGEQEYVEEAKEESKDAKTKYTGTSEMKLDGKTYQYDEYQQEFDMEGYSEDGGDAEISTYVYAKRYLVDDDGELYAIVQRNEQKGADGEENELVFQRIEHITKFEENKAPDDIFELPKDYKKIDAEDM